MSPSAKWEYYAMMHVRYHKAKSRKEKSQILTEFCRSYGCHRKHALRILNGAPPPAKRPCPQETHQALQRPHPFHHRIGLGSRGISLVRAPQSDP